MRIDTIFDVNEKVFFINEDQIKTGEISQITISIDDLGNDTKKFVISFGSKDYKDFCEKYHHELYRSVGELLDSIKSKFSTNNCF